jgi:poly-beta-hydroxyalkanoate depolymerase
VIRTFHEYLAVNDLPAPFYLEMAKVFQTYDLPRAS